MSKIKKRVFEGCGTALVTPFTEDGIDFDSLGELIERQIAAGASAIVFCGTTGEAPTVSREERREIFRFAVKCAAGRAKVIAGCGSNSTREAVRLAKEAENAGADAVLAVSPYYNKGNPDGIVSHYREIARGVGVPVIAYNVPSRTGVDLDLSVCKRLAEEENVAGIKEASGSVSRAACIASYLGESLPLYSGSDEVNLPILSIGGAGIISVLSNIFPAACVSMCRAAAAGDFTTAREIASDLYPFTASLFCEVNPIPVKTVLSHMGLCREIFRLPICRISDGKRENLIKEYERAAEKYK